MRYRELAVAFLFVAACRSGGVAPRPNDPLAAVQQAQQAAMEGRSPVEPQGRAREVLCADDDDACSACGAGLTEGVLVECLIEARYGSDPDARDLARSLYAKTGVLPGTEKRRTIEGYRGETVEIFPALPTGDHRHHLAWTSASLDEYRSFLEGLTPHATREIGFRPFPNALQFYRTEARAYPSAYATDGVVAYNLEGELHGNERDVLETLFHEVFHLNDEQRGAWSVNALGPVFDAIVARCGNDHDCFSPFAPHDTVVPNGTFYAFDERTRDVREYAAELALRFFLEHRAILTGDEPRPAFKCLAEENRTSWSLLSEEFFGGADLSGDCEEG